jgi:hypothetical protein
MLYFIFDCRHYELVVIGLNITVMKVKHTVNLKTFHWHPKVGIIGSQEEISSQSKSIERQVKIVLNMDTHKHIVFMVPFPVNCLFYLPAVVFLEFLTT